MVCHAGEQEKPFWSSSLGQMVQFDTIIFGITFKNYFGRFVWIEKSHYNSRASLDEAPTKYQQFEFLKCKFLELFNKILKKIYDGIVFIAMSRLNRQNFISEPEILE